MYDSRIETSEHIRQVNRAIHQVVCELLDRANKHDHTKLVPPEKETFDTATERLSRLTYGSREYEQSLEEMRSALKHHYECNRHHPEHFDELVSGMTLIDLVEMFCDWYAAGKRHADGDIFKSIAINQRRFRLSEQLVQILRNTATELEWGNDAGISR